MFTIREYVVAEELQEAYDLLNKGRNNSILGGLLWLKMGNKNINTAIDLSNLGLNKIEEDKEFFKIGCMTTLREVETHKELNKHFGGVLRKSVENIVGVQFRNCATMGGSIYSRFGFSDILTALLALDTYVEMYKGGIISLQNFVNMPYEKDILVRVIVRKNSCKATYLSHRISATDLPVLAVGVSLAEGVYNISVGARPNKASLLKVSEKEIEIEKVCEDIVTKFTFGTNLRGSKEYREVLAKTLVRRGIEEVNGGSHAN